VQTALTGETRLAGRSDVHNLHNARIGLRKVRKIAGDFARGYLYDETQTVARAYGAVCTPDFFGYNADRKLKYRGRLDEGRTTPPRAGAPRELVEAMRVIATTGVAPADQKASVGCSIKWKDE
jgi:hypothetical protein